MSGQRGSGKAKPKVSGAKNSMSRQQYLARLDYEWSEKYLQDEVDREFRAAGWLTYHTHISKGSEGGFPDTVALHEPTGRQVVMELKVRKEKPTAKQRAWMRAFRRSGAEVYLFYPHDFHTVVKLAAGGYRLGWEWRDPGERVA